MIAGVAVIGETVSAGAVAVSRCWPDQYARVLAARRRLHPMTADAIAWSWAVRAIGTGWKLLYRPARGDA